MRDGRGGCACASGKSQCVRATMVLHKIFGAREFAVCCAVVWVRKGYECIAGSCADSPLLIFVIHAANLQIEPH